MIRLIAFFMQPLSRSNFFRDVVVVAQPCREGVAGSPGDQLCRCYDCFANCR